MKNFLLFILIVFTNCLFAQSHIDSLKLLLPNKQGLQKVELLNEISFKYWNVSPDEGLDYANMAYSISLKNDSKNHIAKSLQNIGINFWAKGDLDLALENFEKSLKIYEDINDQRGISSLLNNMGIVYKNLSNYEKAINFYCKALKIAQKEGYTKIYAKTIGNLSLIYLAQKNYTKATEYTQEAINLSISQNNTENLSAEYNTLGQIFEYQNKYKKAKINYLKSLEINKKDKNNYGTTISLYNIGNTEYHLKNYVKAIYYFKESLILSTLINDQIGVLLANKSIGLVYKELNKFDIALSYYKKSLDLAIKLNVREEKLDIYKNYSELYKSIGKFNKSLDYLEDFISLKDSLFNENSSKQIAEMQTKYDSEKKEKENELLRKNNEIQNLEIAKQTNLRNSFIGVSLLVILMILILLNRFSIKKKANQQLILKNEVISNQHDKLKEINSTKDKFFSIISHDLRSPFNSILGLTTLLVENFNTYDNSKKIKILNSLNEASNHAFELLTNLLTWARTQTGRIEINKEQLNLKELIETSIAPYIYNATKKHIEITINIPSNSMLLIDKNTSITFLGNLVNNAIKFTPERGTIQINYQENEDTIELHIIDSGIGMTSNVIEKLFKIDENISTKGTNNEKGTGLGLILCKEFINLNGGDISVISKVEKGSKFIITLPK